MGICKMGIKRIKTQSQRITSSGYLKKIQNQRTVAGSGYFKKTSQNCRVSRKPGKEEPGRFLGGYFTFTIWDLGFKTSIDRQTHRLVVGNPWLCHSNHPERSVKLYCLHDHVTTPLTLNPSPPKHSKRKNQGPS